MSMTDRELLELAARAARIGLMWLGDTARLRGPIERVWNPLADDGDALRLAVECLGFYTLQYSNDDWEYCNHDGYAATRRAIVRTAAEIGAGLREFPSADEIRDNWT